MKTDSVSSDASGWLRRRVGPAAVFALKHLAITVLVAGGAAALVFLVWYPYPFSRISSGRELFVLLVVVDIVAGPLLSFIVYDRAKPKGELVRDLAVIVALQASALAYGLYSVALARPVWVAFEGDRFRVVTVADVQSERLHDAPVTLQQLSWTGPRPLGVRLVGPDDEGYLASIELSLAGVHPAFRPERWVDYATQADLARRAARPSGELMTGADGTARVQGVIAPRGLSSSRVGYLPLFGRHHSAWVVLLDLHDGRLIGYLPLGDS